MALTEPLDTYLATDGEPGATDDGAAGLEDWVYAITERELPLFAQALGEISSVVSQAESSAADLARAITLDISMSVRLLKIANSPMLNPQDRDIDSVRTAVVLMGFDAVRDLSFSLSLVKELHKDDGNQRLLQQLAHSFHTASHAQALARAGGDRYPEEAFVAGLLLNLGQMAFWSRERPETAELEAMLAKGVPADEAERQVLGFPLRQLSRRLAEEWRMSSLLRTTLASAASDSPRCRNLLLADEVAHAVEYHGWDARETRRQLQRVVDALDLPKDDVETTLKAASRAAAKMAGRFGVESVERLLAPRPQAATPEGAPEAFSEPPAAGADPSAEAVPGPEPDGQAAEQAANDLDALLQGRVDIDRLMRVALGGIHAGLGMDRAFFAMLSPNRVWLKARYAVGHDEQALLRYCRINVGPEARNLFRVLLESGKAVWVDAGRRDRLGDLITPDIDDWARGAPFYAMPVFVRGRAVGLLYADRAESGRDLDDASFEGFRGFGTQIAQGLGQR